MWKNTKVMVTGGASFIGSHLVDTLIKRGAIVSIADDLSSGRLENLQYYFKKQTGEVLRADNITFYKGDLKDKAFTSKALKGNDVVFHLAALHGGRGYIATHPAQCCTNMILDQLVFEESYKNGVERICFASSACVYPSYLQESEGSDYQLKEPDAHQFERDKAMADLEYGWAKLMGEMTLQAYHRQYGMKTAATRIFTAYGPRENETHAIIALIAKAFVGMDPYEIWGTGEQDRNFTYVQDIVDIMMLTAEKIEDGSPINAGRDDRITMNKAAEIVFDIMNWHPKKIFHDTSKPTGVASRAADLTKTRSVLKYEPEVGYYDGFKRTIEYYTKTHDQTYVKDNLTRLLTER